MSVADERVAVAIIPARFDSSRFPGKALAPIAGRPMIEHVVLRTFRAQRLAEVCVATDDERIAAVAEKAGARVVMTSREFESGTDRVAAAAADIDSALVVNVQGDQPLIDPASLDALVDALSDADAATLAAPLTDEGDWQNPDVVKVVVSEANEALYFSRSPIPCWQGESGARPRAARKHIGVYGFRREILLRYATWPVSELERVERLEQLRLLGRGVRIRVVDVATEAPSVDRPEDVARVEQWLAAGRC